MDGAVTDETDPVATDPDLDLFDERERPALRTGVRRALSGGAGGAQPRHHRLGPGRTPTYRAPLVFRPAIHRAAHMGRPANGRSHHRTHQAAPEHVLRRRAREGQPSARGIAAASHAAQLARHVEPAGGTDPRRATPGPHHCPALVINAEADTGVYPSDASASHDALASTDKTRPRSTPITTSHAGARSEKADTIAEWIAARWRWRDSVAPSRPEIVAVLTRGGEFVCLVSMSRHRTTAGQCGQPTDRLLAGVNDECKEGDQCPSRSLPSTTTWPIPFGTW